MDNINHLVATAKQQINSINELTELDDIRVKYLGKKGALTALLKNLNSLSADERPKMGQIVNDAKTFIAQLLQGKKEHLVNAELNVKLATEVIDITLPGRRSQIGSLHPITKVRTRMEELFRTLGFEVLEGPEIEDEFHNFTALNIPEHHPARAATDTFYLEHSDYLLRTQTSPVQIRAMEEFGVPIRAIAPGKVYRCDYDPTHVPMFHQLEGFVVDENVTFANLKGILNDFLEMFFEKKVATRFRPSYFPFTEPSAEVDLQCVLCDGEGCRVCGNTGWIEVLGCGMVHPKVLDAVNIDSEKYTGFAFGMGIDRFAMFKYQINDLRLLFENDIRFLEQF